MASEDKRIGCLANELGVSTVTIKKWEREGKIPEARRNIWDHRVYTEKEIEEIIKLVKKKNYFKSN